MVMEVQKKEGDVMDVADDGYISDSEAFSSVVDVLTGVAMAPNMVDQSDRDQYDFLVSIINPEEGKDPEQEALLVTALKALSGAISKLNITFHASLLSNIFSLSVWNYGFDTRKAVLELIISLATVPDKFLDGCLHMLVANFMPPTRMRAYISHPRFTDKRNIHSELFVALHRIVNLVPLAPMMLKDIIDKRMPKAIDKREVFETLAESFCMTVMNAYKSKFAQFVMFYASNLGGDDADNDDEGKDDEKNSLGG